MIERQFSSSNIPADLLRFLQDRCQMKIVRLRQETEFKFDAVLVGKDPMNVIVVEWEQNANQSTLKQVARKIQSFAWSIYSQKKHNLVTLILVLPEMPFPDKIRRTLGNLNGSARLFLLSESDDPKQMEAELNALVAPAFAMSHKEAVGFVQLQELMKGIDAGPILTMSESSASDDELKSKLLERFERLASEVEIALKKP